MSETTPTSGRRKLDAYFTVSLQVAERLARGEADAAIGVLRRELARTTGAEDTEGRGFLYGLLAVCHGRSGDPEGTLGVLEEMERELPDDLNRALRLGEGYLLLLGEADRAMRWARRARELVGDDDAPESVGRRGRALALEGRAALQGGDRDAALTLLAEAELPDPELAEALLAHGAAPDAVRESLERGLPRHEAHERTGAAPTARSDEVRRILAGIDAGRGGGP